MPRLFVAIAVSMLSAISFASAQTSTPAAATAAFAVEAPHDIVARLYRAAVADAKTASDASPFFDPKIRKKYFSRAFAALVTEAETAAARDGDAGLDFDPISAAQDAGIHKVTVKTDMLDEGKAVVSASVLNYTQPTVVTYDFVRDGGEWKIDDIEGTIETQAWSVRKLLKDMGTETTALPDTARTKPAPDPETPARPK